jgi:hypothetical protein
MDDPVKAGFWYVRNLGSHGQRVNSDAKTWAHNFFKRGD